METLLQNKVFYLNTSKYSAIPLYALFGFSGMDCVVNHVIRGQFYKGFKGKLPFSYIFLVKFHCRNLQGAVI